MPDRSKQNRGIRAHHLLPIGTRNNFAPAAKFSYPSACHPPLAGTKLASLRGCSVRQKVGSSWITGKAQTLFIENILERGHKLVKEVTPKFKREHCLNPESASWRRRLSLRATGYFFDRLNSYLSEWRAFSRKGVWANTGSEGGQTLVELMIAMSVMSIGLLGVFAVLSQSLGLNRVVANQYVAANLAAEGIEVVKNITDSDVLGGKPWNDSLPDGDFGVEYTSEALNRDWANQNLNFDAASGIYSYGGGRPTNFKRTISITNINSNEIKVKSVVKWRDRGGTEFSIDLEDRFFNWR